MFYEKQVMSLPLRIFSLYVQAVMAFAMGFVCAWWTKLPDTAVAIALATIPACALYNIVVIGYWLYFSQRRTVRRVG